MKLFRNFFKSETIGGSILLLSTVLSLIVANSGWAEAYTSFWHQHLHLSISRFRLDLSIEQWINDGLMAIFFLLVGLEIKREFVAGELSAFSNTVLPLAAAIGGMLIPAGIYLLLNSGMETSNGFGIPMATDIAFTLGMLALAGNRIPHSLSIFLTALAIIDDIGAIIVIAVFYNGGIQWAYLIVALGIVACLSLFSRLGVKQLALYLIPGLALWYCTMQSGVHPTIAGVLFAFTIPDKSAQSPSLRLQLLLHKPVAFIILPLFALANTGIVLGGSWWSSLSTTSSLGIIAGLVVGKPVGIVISCWLLIKTGRFKLPVNVNWAKLTGAAALAGIGFTMSIFIANLAFGNQQTVNTSKVAVLSASLLASLIGLSILFSTKKLAEK